MGKEPLFKPLAETPDGTRLLATLERNELDKALIQTAQLMVANLKHCDPGTKEYIAAIGALGKLLVDIKKLQPKDSSSPLEALAELETWLARAKGA